MIAGKRDVGFVELFNSNMRTYSDDGEVFNGAYGYRWREYFGYDQLSTAAELLKRNPNTRQVVVAMWDAYEDLGSKSVDLPCNVMVLFRIVNGELNMTTFNRSNDLIWGLLGANAVHLTVLHEYMGAMVGIPLGPWYHCSNNLHVYEKHWHLLLDQVEKDSFNWEYQPYPTRIPIDNPDDFYEDCLDLCDGKVDYFVTPFFDGVVAPVVQSWQAWKAGNREEAVRLAQCIEADDWRIAVTEWYGRRMANEQTQQSIGSA